MLHQNNAKHLTLGYNLAKKPYINSPTHPALDVYSPKTIILNTKSHSNLLSNEAHVKYEVAPDEKNNINIQVMNSLTEAKAVWKELQGVAYHSLYQSYEWSCCWQKHIGNLIGADPRIVVGFNSKGKLQFILPLQRRKNFGAVVLEWHGSPDMAYGFGLYHPDFFPESEAWLKDNFYRIVPHFDKIDAVSLVDMPATLGNHKNPFGSMAKLAGANHYYSTDLSLNYDQIYTKKRSSSTRKNKRRNDLQLARAGNIIISALTEDAEIELALTQMFKDKIHKLSAKGVRNVFSPMQQNFIRAVAQQTDQTGRLLETYSLRLNDEVLAVMLGAVMSNSYWFFMTSMTNGPLQKLSPGDMLLRHKIEACCKASVLSFDFGVGDAEYKTQWADDIISQINLLSGQNLRGKVWVLYQACKISIKRIIKQNKRLRAYAYGLRRLTLKKKYE